MPSASDRLLYSPVEGDLEQQYDALHWGLKPKWTEEVTLKGSRHRQQAVCLGRLRALILGPDGTGIQCKKTKGRPFPYLAVGSVDNRLDITGDVVFKLAVDEFFGDAGGEWLLYGIHYDAKKGSDEVIYWTHDFEPELPRLRIDRSGWPLIVGGSYFVAPEGIVG